MGLRIWKPTCPSCGKGLKIQKGQVYVQCEQCGSSLIIEGWELETKPLDINRNPRPDEYRVTGTFGYVGDHPFLMDDLPDYSFEYRYPHPPVIRWRKK